MKRLTPLLCLLLAVFLPVMGCAPAVPAAAEDTPAPTASVPNPVIATDADGLSQAGLPIAPPEDAENIAYSMIDGEIAQIQFAYNGLNYIYRASRTLTDISGVYEQFKDEALTVHSDYEDFGLTVTVRSIVGGGELGNWTSDGVSFSLYVRSAIGAEEHAALCTILGEQAHYAITGSGIEAEVTAQYLVDTLTLYIDAPSGAENVSYSIYDDSIARVEFDHDGSTYEFRAARHPSLIALPSEFLRTEEVDVESGFLKGTMTLRFNDGADAAACWTIDSVSYQLYTLHCADTGALLTLAMRLATDANAREASLA